MLDTFLSPFIDRDDGSEEDPEQVQELVDRIEPIFVFSITWSMACTVSGAYNNNLTTFTRRGEEYGHNESSSEENMIYDYAYDAEENSWKPGLRQ